MYPARARLHGPPRLAQDAGGGDSMWASALTAVGSGGGGGASSTTEVGQWFSSTEGSATVMALNAVGSIYGIPAGSIVQSVASLFGGQVLSHEERERRELGRTTGQVQAMIAEIHAAGTPEVLWTTLVKWQSGYVGGSTPLAVAVSLPGLTPAEWTRWVILPTGMQGFTLEQVARTMQQRHGWSSFSVEELLRQHPGVGTPNQWYPVYTPAGFFQALVAHPTYLHAGVQAGVTQASLDASNQAVASAILGQLAKLAQAGQLQRITATGQTSSGGLTGATTAGALLGAPIFPSASGIWWFWPALVGVGALGLTWLSRRGRRRAGALPAF